MKHLKILSILAATLAGVAPAYSTTHTGAPVAAGEAKKMSSSAMPADMADGEVRKIDMENKKITLKHGEIKNLDMPGMTMVFQVKDTTILDKVKAGDKVRFKAEKAGGALVVTDIQPAK